MNLEAVSKLLDEAEAILDSHPPGNNPEALRELKQVASALLVASDNNAVIDIKSSSMIECAETVYAPRKRKQWTREEAAHFAAHDLASMRQLVQEFRSV